MKTATQIIFTFALAMPALPQQMAPRFELYALTGVYEQGNQVLAPQSYSLAKRWRPQVGAGVLAPLGKS